MSEIIGLMYWLQVKHFIFDFLWQPEWMLKDKGKLFYTGGMAHAWCHTIPTFLAISLLIPWTKALIISMLEFWTHYFIDFSKVRINDVMGFKPNNKEFWQLLGLDQFLHQVTYILIVWSVVVFK